MSTSLEDSRALADAVNALNARRASRAEAAANFVVVLVVALLLAAAVLHFLTPCHGAELCGAALLPRRGTTWWRRLYMPMRAAYLRMLMRSCVADIWHHQQTAELAPVLEAMARQRLDELRVQLIDCDLSTRRS